MPSLTLGPFAVARDGTLHPREAERSPALRFAWRGHRCEAALTPDALRLAAIAARVPSTAEPNADRGRAFEMVAALPGSLPPGWRLALTPDHRIRLEAEAQLQAPPTVIYQANQDQIRDPERIYPGQVFNLPGGPEADSPQ